MLCAIAVSDTGLSREINTKLTLLSKEYKVWQVETINTLQQIRNFDKIHLLITDYLLETEAGYQLLTEFGQLGRLDQVFFYTDCHFLQWEIEQAMRGFEFAEDVILKELGSDWLVHKVNQYFNKSNKLSNFSDRLLIQSDGATTLLNPEEIIFIEKVRKQLIFHTVAQEYHTYGTLNDLERRLPAYFCRSHRSYLVNLRKIRSIYSHGRSFVVTFSNITQKAILSYDRQKLVLEKYR